MVPVSSHEPFELLVSVARVLEAHVLQLVHLCVERLQQGRQSNSEDKVCETTIVTEHNGPRRACAPAGGACSKRWRPAARSRTSPAPRSVAATTPACCSPPPPPDNTATTRWKDRVSALHPCLCRRKHEYLRAVGKHGDLAGLDVHLRAHVGGLVGRDGLLQRVANRLPLRRERVQLAEVQRDLHVVHLAREQLGEELVQRRGRAQVPGDVLNLARKRSVCTRG
jgi:hypothetical protein